MCNHWWWNLTRVTSLSEFHCTKCWEPICRTMNHMFLTCGVLWFTVNLLSTLSELHFMAHKKSYWYVDKFFVTDGETDWPWLCTTTWDRKHSPNLRLEVHELPHRYFLQFLAPVMFIIQLIQLLEKTHWTHCIPESQIEANIHSHDCGPTYKESSIKTGDSSANCKSIPGVVFTKNTVLTIQIVWS